MSSDGLRVAVAHDVAALQSVAEEWDGLLCRQALPSPTLTAAWLSTHDSEGDPRLVLVRRRGRLLAGGAFRVARVGPVRVGTWLGGNRLPGLLSDGDAPLEAASKVVETMRGECEILWLTRINPLGSTRASVAAALPWARSTPVVPSGYLTPLPPPRLEYARSRAAYETRRAERKGVALRVLVSRRPEEVLEAFDRLVALYLLRWGDDRQAGSGYSDVVTERATHRRLLPDLAARDAVRIVEVVDGDHLLASVLGFVHGTGALFHTTATDPTSAVRGPGHLAMLAWVEEAMALGATQMYLGRGGGDPQGPKARLGATEVPLVDVLAATTRLLQPGLGAAAAVRTCIGRGA